MEGVFYWGKAGREEERLASGNRSSRREERMGGGTDRHVETETERKRDGRGAGPLLKGNIMNVHRRCS